MYISGANVQSTVITAIVANTVHNGLSLPLSTAGNVTAGSFTLGTTYVITSIGTTNFMAIGAGANTVGQQFTATGAGSGTGTASVVTLSLVGDTGINSLTITLASNITANAGATITATSKDLGQLIGGIDYPVSYTHLTLPTKA